MPAGNYLYNSWSGTTITQPALGLGVAGDTYMFALDMDNHSFYVGRNGTWGLSANPASGAAKTGATMTGFTGAVYPGITSQNGGSGTANFGATTFKYAVPAGYNAGIFN